MRGIHRSPVNYPHKASDAELWRFLLSAPEQTAEQKIEIAIIWDAIAPIMTSLQWAVCTVLVFNVTTTVTGVFISMGIPFDHDFYLSEDR